MMETIKYLSSDELKGRGIDTPEIEKLTNILSPNLKNTVLSLVATMEHTINRGFKTFWIKNRLS